MKILAIRIRYLGDALLLRPVLRALKKAHPGARVDALVASGTAAALDGCPWADAVIEWPRGDGFDAARLLARIVASRYDWVIDLTGNDRSALVALLSHARLRACYFRPKKPWHFWRNRVYNVRPMPEVRKPHIIEQHLRLLAACGVPPDGTDLDLAPAPADAAWARDWAANRRRARTLAAHLSSRDMQKSLPVALVRDVLERLLDGGASVWLTHGPAPEEAAYARACAAGFEARGLELVSAISWGQLVALIAAADAWWGVDTAPMHAAWGLGKPVLAHFGPSKVEHWRPLGAGSHAMAVPCACLLAGRNTCDPGRSGRCWSALDPEATAERIRALFAVPVSAG